jgi:hypothetical protein
MAEQQKPIKGRKRDFDSLIIDVHEKCLRMVDLTMKNFDLDIETQVQEFKKKLLLKSIDLRKHLASDVEETMSAVHETQIRDKKQRVVKKWFEATYERCIKEHGCIPEDKEKRKEALVASYREDLDHDDRWYDAYVGKKTEGKAIPCAYQHNPYGKYCPDRGNSGVKCPWKKDKDAKEFNGIVSTMYFEKDNDCNCDPNDDECTMHSYLCDLCFSRGDLSSWHMKMIDFKFMLWKFETYCKNKETELNEKQLGELRNKWFSAAYKRIENDKTKDTTKETMEYWNWNRFQSKLLVSHRLDLTFEEKWREITVVHKQKDEEKRRSFGDSDSESDDEDYERDGMSELASCMFQSDDCSWPNAIPIRSFTQKMFCMHFAREETPSICKDCMKKHSMEKEYMNWMKDEFDWKTIRKDFMDFLKKKDELFADPPPPKKSSTQPATKKLRVK